MGLISFLFTILNVFIYYSYHANIKCELSIKTAGTILFINAISQNNYIIKQHIKLNYLSLRSYTVHKKNNNYD